MTLGPSLTLEGTADAQLQGVLGTLQHGRDDEGVALARCTSDGARLSACRPGAPQTHVSLPRGMFRSFSLTGTALELALPVRSLLQALALAPGEDMHATLHSSGAHMTLGPSVACDLAALDAEAAGTGASGMSAAEPLALRVLSSAAYMRNVLSEAVAALPGTSSANAAFRLVAVPGAPALRLHAEDAATGTTLDATFAVPVAAADSPADAEDAAAASVEGIERYVCAAPVDALYPTAGWLSAALAVLARATRASLRVSGTTGALALQAMVPCGLASAYVEFVVFPLFEDSE